MVVNGSKHIENDGLIVWCFLQTLLKHPSTSLILQDCRDLGSSFWQHLADRCWLCEICTVQVRRGRGWPGEKQNAAVLWQQLDLFDIFSMGFSIMTYYNPLHLNMFAANPTFDRAGSQLIATWSRMKINGS
jgi:hypothetical protein